MKGDPYKRVVLNGVRTVEHVLIAESVLGKKLPLGAVVHHADGNPRNNAKMNLVICPDQAYHFLLHTRMDALAACGNASWLKCEYCKQYDDPANLRLYKQKRGANFKGRHRKCHAEAQIKRYRESPKRAPIRGPYCV